MAREWNLPVHAFLRRHVYSASKVHTSRPVATIITFLISALAHELVMGCITRKFRGYGFFAMMLQMPIVMVQRSRWVKGRTLLNNVLFWCSMILGLSMVSGQAQIAYRAVLTLYRCVLFMSWSEGQRLDVLYFSASRTYHPRYGSGLLFARYPVLDDAIPLDCRLPYSEVSFSACIWAKYIGLSTPTT
jgi:hypothetical protein